MTNKIKNRDDPGACECRENVFTGSQHNFEVEEQSAVGRTPQEAFLGLEVHAEPPGVMHECHARRAWHASIVGATGRQQSSLKRLHVPRRGVFWSEV